MDFIVRRGFGGAVRVGIGWGGIWARWIHQIALSGLGCGGGWGDWGCGGRLASCVQRREHGACAPHIRMFIRLVSFSETLLVVSILNMVYDCHMWPLLQS